MLAILGEIEVQLQTGFTALEATLGGEFAEQARIGRKPGLQWVGDKGDEYRLSVRFHQQYCQPTAQWQRLQAACRAHQALAFVLGNGEYLGHFVITTLTGRTLLAHADGIAQCLEVDISLREFTGDLRQPLAAGDGHDTEQKSRRANTGDRQRYTAIAGDGSGPSGAVGTGYGLTGDPGGAPDEKRIRSRR